MQIFKDYLLQHLINIKPAEEELKSLSMYIAALCESHLDIIQCIQYIYNKSGIHHRLTLYYLIYEIILSIKSSSGLLLKAELKEFVKLNFINDRNKTLGMPLNKKYVSLYEIFSKIVCFDDKFILEVVLSKITECFNDKKTLVNYLHKICNHYESKNNNQASEQQASEKLN